MTTVRSVCLVSMLACLSLSATQAPKVSDPKSQSTRSAARKSLEPVRASLLQLIATPQQYDGKIVRVIGFCFLEFEGNALYIHRQDFEQSIPMNGVWLAVDYRKQEFSNRYVIVEGRFDAKDHGHMGLFAGAINDVTRIEPWRSRREKLPAPPDLRD